MLSCGWRRRCCELVWHSVDRRWVVLQQPLTALDAPNPAALLHANPHQPQAAKAAKAETAEESAARLEMESLASEERQWRDAVGWLVGASLDTCRCTTTRATIYRAHHPPTPLTTLPPTGDRARRAAAAAGARAALRPHQRHQDPQPVAQDHAAVKGGGAAQADGGAQPNPRARGGQEGCAGAGERRPDGFAPAVDRLFLPSPRMLFGCSHHQAPPPPPPPSKTIRCWTMILRRQRSSTSRR